MCMYFCMAIHFPQRMDQPDVGADRARGELVSENKYFPVPVRA